jgi:hypothetical protein
VAAYNPTFKLDDVWKLAEGKFEAVTMAEYLFSCGEN